jgi:hypothetical protein
MVLAFIASLNNRVCLKFECARAGRDQVGQFSTLPDACLPRPISLLCRNRAAVFQKLQRATTLPGVLAGVLCLYTATMYSVMPNA